LQPSTCSAFPTEERLKAGACVEKQVHAKTIGEVVMEAQKNGISSTPTFVIGDQGLSRVHGCNGSVVSWMSLRARRPRTRLR
jgi:protein-disulfide isomerase